MLTVWTGEGVATTTGALTIGDWIPTNGFEVEDLVDTLTLYTDLSISAQHSIPASGLITLTFTSVDIQSAFYNFDTNQQTGSNSGYCYVHYNELYSVSCDVTSATTLNLTTTNILTAGTEIKLTLLTKFNGATPSVTGTSYVAASSFTIDTSAAALTLSYSSNVVKMSTYQFIIAKGFD
mmetsp:Transcript_13685/g.2184  ORF Transcript_13685/g.2184 Transcript_13685/m.2184 type:complete len:179 (+) Transcript_13685:577-1113(+)